MATAAGALAFISATLLMTPSARLVRGMLSWSFRRIWHLLPDSRFRKRVIREPLVSDGTPDYFQATDAVMKMIGDSALQTIYVLPAGGGGDLLGTFLSILALKDLFLKRRRCIPRIIVVTTNLKRGAENPRGGPLDMSRVLDISATPVQPVRGTRHLYPVARGMFSSPDIVDRRKQVVAGILSHVALGEGALVDQFDREDVELLMIDITGGGRVMARDLWRLMALRGHQPSGVLVLGIDMGGDIAPSIPLRPMGESHPDRNVSSPTTDDVCLGMMVELARRMPGRVLTGIAALGGDGESTLQTFEHYRTFPLAAVVDMVSFLKQHPRNDLLAWRLESAIATMPSEVSANWLKRIIAAAGLADAIEGKERFTWVDKWEALRREHEVTPAHWRDLQWLFAPMDPRFQGDLLRGGTRRELIANAYPFLVFVDPRSIEDGKEDPAMRNTRQSWWDKNREFERRGFVTEQTDEHNIRQRAEVNARQILIASMRGTSDRFHRLLATDPANTGLRDSHLGGISRPFLWPVLSGKSGPSSSVLSPAAVLRSAIEKISMHNALWDEVHETADPLTKMLQASSLGDYLRLYDALPDYFRHHFDSTFFRTLRGPLHKIVVSIDGGDCSGKAEVAGCLARRLSSLTGDVFFHVDVGLLYRALTLAVVDDHDGVPALRDDLDSFLQKADISFRQDLDGPAGIVINGRVYSALMLDREDRRISGAVVSLSENFRFHRKLFQSCRLFGEKHNVVVAGRNTGTDIFPDATLKIFLQADLEVRAERMLGKSPDCLMTASEAAHGIRSRDARDARRRFAPVRRAEDAVIVDTTTRSAEETTDLLVTMLRRIPDGIGNRGEAVA